MSALPPAPHTAVFPANQDRNFVCPVVSTTVPPGYFPEPADLNTVFVNTTALNFLGPVIQDVGALNTQARPPRHAAMHYLATWE